MITYLDVITGFLGAGKTTFLERYADHLRRTGVSFCIIENEFGRAGVDGARMGGASDQLGIRGGSPARVRAGGAYLHTRPVAAISIV